MRAQNPGTTDYIQPETLKTKIENEYKQILTCAQKHDYSSLNSIKDDLSVVINIYNLVTGSSANYNDRIKSLTEESEKLKKLCKTYRFYQSKFNRLFCFLCRWL